MNFIFLLQTSFVFLSPDKIRMFVSLYQQPASKVTPHLSGRGSLDNRELALGPDEEK
jgi:hypothetical protein